MNQVGRELNSIALEGIKELLSFCGEDPTREGLLETPVRFVKALAEMTNGYTHDPALFLRKSFDITDTEGVTSYDELIMSGALPFTSVCEHHLLPFLGYAYIGYIPNIEGGRVVGLSKIARLLDGYANRFQIQERLTRQIGDAMERELKPVGIGVVLKAKHTCQCLRGVKKQGYMMTSAMYGALKDKPEARNEFLQLMALEKVL